MKRRIVGIGVPLCLLFAGGCKEKELDAAGAGKGDACDPEATEGDEACAEGLSCSPSASSPGDHVCGTPYLIRGMVYDALDESPIEGALVAALDVTSAPVTDVAETDEDGNYELEAPVPRDDAGEPVEGVKFTLMASAADYQPFPAGVRPAIPIAVADAVPGEDGDDENEDPDNLVIENAATDIAMIPLPEGEQGGVKVEGDVLADEPAGTLVVAEGTDPARSAVADLSGHYVLFNVPAGAATITGYRADLQLDPASVDVAGDDLEGVDLEQSDAGLATLTGSANIVNAPGGSVTSIVLVPSSVFNEALERGPVPFGLRAPDPGFPPDVSGAWSIEGVPHGTYKILAAFENDFLVRDPDESIAGTQIVELTIDGGGTVDVGESFKITEALAVFGPGVDEPEIVTAAPDFVFADDSSEDMYHVVLYDALGELVWEDAAVPGVSGSERVTVPYGGDALTPGMYYQFRATSKKDGSSISRTEDLRGIFVFQPEG